MNKNRKSPRLKNWDYGSNSAYFITICTKNREHFFGEIENGKMKISPAGTIAHVLWHEIKNHAKNIELGEFVVMPNHIHGILILNGNDRGDVACNVPTIINGNVPTVINDDDPTGNVPTEINDSVPTVTTKSENQSSMPFNEKMAVISPKPNTISSIIRSYKSAVTNYCNRLELPMTWQSRYHDHIIRNGESFLRISEYIKNNPANWKEDKFL